MFVRSNPEPHDHMIVLDEAHDAITASYARGVNRFG